VVTAPPRERTALLVIRAWIEGNGESQLRARITQTADLNGRKEISTAAATRDDIARAVTEWLDRLLDKGR
jgi:hypothetical protein